MALKGIINSDHGRLLWEIDNLPYDQSVPLKNKLTAAYDKYNRQLSELAETIAAYEKVAAKVRPRQNLRKAETENSPQFMELV